MATSGSASATGLQVQNAVNLKAWASVIVDGDNYAPIFIRIIFITAVDNRGWAQASTGAVQTAGQLSGTSAATPSSNGASGSAAGPNAGRSGPATAVNDSVKVTAISHQSANANGVGVNQTADPSTMATAAVTTVPGGANSSNSQWPYGPLDPSEPPSGAWATSGAARAAGMQATVDARNLQIAACTTPEKQRQEARTLGPDTMARASTTSRAAGQALAVGS